MRFLGLLGIFMQLIRWRNLMIIASCQALFYFLILQKNTSFDFSEHMPFFTLCFSTLFIASGGYVINDIYDIECDQINKPNSVYFPNPFSIKFGMRTYAVLSSFGFLLATWFSSANRSAVMDTAFCCNYFITLFIFKTI